VFHGFSTNHGMCRSNFVPVTEQIYVGKSSVLSQTATHVIEYYMT
jgi:hypothetical protein